MTAFALAFATSFIGLILIFLTKSKNNFQHEKTAMTRYIGGTGTMAAATLLLWWIYYANLPSFVWPFFGMTGVFVITLWFVSAIIDSSLKSKPSILFFLPLAGLLAFAGRGCASNAMFRSASYAQLIGEVETREWTQDVQPKDPKHIRLVPYELAAWLADKQLGTVAGAIGSQFEVAKDFMTLQMIGGELWYVAPLDYRGFGVWTSAKNAPGYVMIHGEDPLHPVTVKTDEKYTYMPGAYFDENLERHLWNNGFMRKGLTDYSFEINEKGKGLWVVTVFEPTIGWWGKKALGVAIVNPVDGKIDFHEMGKIPHWVDRVVPYNFVTEYITYWGEYSQGWWNSFWAKNNIIHPLEPNIVYGSDHEPYWVADLTSSNKRDDSLVGLMYVNSRTGKAVKYHASGGTDRAVLAAVNNSVAYMHLHGTSPILYNIYGKMTSIVPVLGASHTFNGVAIVELDNLQVAYGKDQYIALREFQQKISMSGQQIAPNTQHNQRTIECEVIRFASETKGQGTMYFLLVNNENRLFTGSSELSPKLPLTRAGDKVKIEYIETDEDVVTIMKFDNLHLQLRTTADQKAVKEKVEERKSGAESSSTKGALENAPEKN